MNSELIKKLESASEGSRELDVEVLNAAGKSARMWTSTAMNPFGARGLPRPDAVQGHGNLMRPAPKVSTSLDAAVSLIEETMGGWHEWRLRKYGTKYLAKVYSTELVPSSGQQPSGDFDRWTRHETPALALCIALLKALETGGET